MMKRLLFLLVGSSVVLSAPHLDSSSFEKKRKELSEYLEKEKLGFQAREKQRQSLVEELDALNSTQNQTRRKISEIDLQKRELEMSGENLALEVYRQGKALEFERSRMGGLLKVLYRLRRDGLLSFLLRGESLTSTVRQGRILYKAIRSHSKLTQRIEERAKRLAKAEEQLRLLRDELGVLLADLEGQQHILTGMLRKKHRLLSTLEKRQGPYRLAVKQHKQITSKLKRMFSKMESSRGGSQLPLVGRKGSLLTPVELGKIIQGFGKSVHKKFKTVTHHKGIEIAAAHGTPVRAVAAGEVEYSGWIPGLGNVLIVHHAGGLYSLSAYLFKSEFKKGEKVDRGEAIALVGDTGGNEEASLYFELRERTKAVNPIAYFDTESFDVLKNGPKVQVQG